MACYTPKNPKELEERPVIMGHVEAFRFHILALTLSKSDVAIPSGTYMKMTPREGLMAAWGKESGRTVRIPQSTGTFITVSELFQAFPDLGEFVYVMRDGDYVLIKPRKKLEEFL